MLGVEGIPRRCTPLCLSRRASCCVCDGLLERLTTVVRFRGSYASIFCRCVPFHAALHCRGLKFVPFNSANVRAFPIDVWFAVCELRACACPCRLTCRYTSAARARGVGTLCDHAALRCRVLSSCRLTQSAFARFQSKLRHYCACGVTSCDLSAFVCPGYLAGSYTSTVLGR